MLNILDITKRIDVYFSIEIVDGNPNGDPANNNRPRTDSHTGQGLITDVCIKRKIRNWIEAQGVPIFIAPGDSLNSKIAAFSGLAGTKTKGKGKEARADRAEGTRKVCAAFWDVRAFGAVLTTGDTPLNNVRGPIQLTFARTAEPAAITSHQLTRCVNTKDDDTNTMTGKGSETGKHIIAQALYHGSATFIPRAAQMTGLSSEDLNLFFRALVNCWHLDRAAARGKMGLRALRIAVHANEDGCAHLADTTTPEPMALPGVRYLLWDFHKGEFRDITAQAIDH